MHGYPAWDEKGVVRKSPKKYMTLVSDLRGSYPLAMIVRFYMLISLLILFASSPMVVWADDVAIDSDAWWEPHYSKIHRTDECKNIKAVLNEARAVDKISAYTFAHSLLAWHYWQGPCFDNDTAFAEGLLLNVAERGNFIAATYLAQMYFLQKGEDAPLAKDWGQRAKHALAPLSSINWKQTFYAPIAEHFRQKKQVLSPHLEQAFSWFENIQHDDPNTLYEIGMSLLDDRTIPEAKVYACRWLYAAKRRGHTQARYRLARQLIFGEGVRQKLDSAMLLLDQSVNQDQNIDAYILVSQLLQKGDIFERDLRKAYIALLRAQKQGASVEKADFERLHAQLPSYMIDSANEDANDSDFLIFLFPTPEKQPLNQSGRPGSMCVFVPN